MQSPRAFRSLKSGSSDRRSRMSPSNMDELSNQPHTCVPPDRRNVSGFRFVLASFAAPHSGTTILSVYSLDRVT